MRKIMVVALAMASATAAQSAERFLRVDRSELVDYTYNWNGQVTQGNDGIEYQGLGIGGPIFGKFVWLTVDYPVSNYVDFIFVKCDDNVGKTKSAQIEIWLDYKYFGKKDVSNTGSSLSFAVHRNVQHVEVRSVRNDGNPVGDETRITQYQSYREL